MRQGLGCVRTDQQSTSPMSDTFGQVGGLAGSRTFRLSALPTPWKTHNKTLEPMPDGRLCCNRMSVGPAWLSYSLGHIIREYERFSFTLVRSRCFSHLHPSGCHNHRHSSSYSQHIRRPCVHGGCYSRFSTDFQGHISVFGEQTAEAKGREAQAR